MLAVCSVWLLSVWLLLGGRVIPALGELMGLALEEAAAALAHGDVPVGAVVIGRDGEVVARRHNERELHGDPTAHAELLALRDAAAHLGAGA